MTKPKKSKPKIKKYAVIVFCQNCRERYECEVPKGQTVWDWLQSSERLNRCNTCGCDIVQSPYHIWGDLLK